MTMQPFLNRFSPIQQLLILIVLVLSSWIFFSLLGTFLGILIFDINTFKNPNDVLNNVSFLKFFQIIQSVSIFILPPFLFAKLISSQPDNWLRINTKTPVVILFVSILITLSAQPFISLTGVLNNQLNLPSFMDGIENWMRSKESAAMDITIKFLSSNSLAETFLNVIIIAILPAIGEEFLFRGVLQKLFTKILKNPHFAIWITAIIFSAIHIQFFGFFPRMLLGLLFGYLVFYYRSIWLAVIAHFTNNLLAFLLFHFSDSSEKLSVLNPGNDYPNLIYLFGSITVCLILLRYVYLEGKKQIISSN